MEDYLASAERGLEALKRMATACDKVAHASATYGDPITQEVFLDRAQKCWDIVAIWEEDIENIVKQHKTRVQDMLQETQALWLKDGLASEEEVVKKIQELEQFQLEEQEKFIKLKKKMAAQEAEQNKYVELLEQGTKAAELDYEKEKH